VHDLSGEWLSSCEWRRLHVLRVEGSSRSRNGGQNRPWDGLGRPTWADRPRPILARFSRALRSCGSSCLYALCPSICTILTMSSLRLRWRVFSHEVQSFTLQSSRTFLCNTSVLATFGSDFIMLSNTNGTPQLLL
jgi:hypothetical protein